MEDKEKILKGYPPSLTDMNLAIYGQMDPDEVKLSPEQVNLYKSLKPKFSPKIGVVTVFGTGGECNKASYFKKLWDDGNK